MKYIRTKDGKILEESKCADFDKHVYSDYMLGELKEADDIEELFDEIVYVTKDGSRPFATHQVKHPNCSDSYDVYGAIWNDKGLIYVAKKNEKGSWELL